MSEWVVLANDSYRLWFIVIGCLTILVKIGTKWWILFFWEKPPIIPQHIQKYIKLNKNKNGALFHWKATKYSIARTKRTYTPQWVIFWVFFILTLCSQSFLIKSDFPTTTRWLKGPGSDPNKPRAHQESWSFNRHDLHLTRSQQLPLLVQNTTKGSQPTCNHLA